MTAAAALQAAWADLTFSTLSGIVFLMSHGVQPPHSLTSVYRTTGYWRFFFFSTTN
jgi:hypothetical protein